jgi:hypothetical protein
MAATINITAPTITTVNQLAFIRGLRRHRHSIQKKAANRRIRR